jgi:RNA polymerase sigma-70 factor, ECF subfamily
MPNQRLKVDAASDQSRSASKESDEALMARICEGDKEALGSLFRRYAHVVRGVAHKVLRDSSEADDLLQDVFLLIHRLCRTFDSSKSPVRFWILQMTYYRAISRRRYLTTRHFYTYLDVDDTPEALQSPCINIHGYEETMAGRLGKETWQRLCDALSENQRETLRLHFFEGYTLNEVAAKLNQTGGNIRNHYFRGLDRLRREIFADKTQGVLKT